jgi:hypothetical protein
MRRLTARVLIVALIGLLAVVGVGADGPRDPFEIRLPNREPFVPPEEIDEKLDSDLGRGDKGIVAAIVQFTGGLTRAERAQVERNGIDLLAYVGGHAYFVWIDRGTLLREFEPAIRWAGPQKPRDKISPALLEGPDTLLQPPHPMLVEEPTWVLVRFLEGTETTMAEGALDGYPSPYTRFGSDGGWAIELTRTQLEDLASKPDVRWIESLPPSFRPPL